MSPKKIPLILSVAILAVAGTAVAVFVHAQSGTTVVKTFAGSATFQYGDAGGSIENNTLLTQKVINLKNTGSHTDVFRTTLPVNPETRCGLRGGNDPYPANVLPNTLPTLLDVELAANGTTYITVACVTKGLSPGPFTWSYRTISYNFLAETGSEKVLAEVQDTVQVTGAIPCSDSDGGINTSVKGIATGTYAGAVASYIAIYGQEPNPTTPKTTTDAFSTYIDHCATSVQLNEGFCAADGRLSAFGAFCPYGCKDGICVVPLSSPSSVSSLSSFSTSSTSSSTPSMSSLSTPAVAVPVGPVISPPGLSNVPADIGPQLPTPVATPAVPPVTHLAPPLERQQLQKAPAQKTFSKGRVKALKKQQQTLRRELRSLERSLLRKKNVAALGQIADLRDELSDLDLRDPSAAETLQSLQKEIADLRLAVTKKVKRTSHSRG